MNYFFGYIGERVKSNIQVPVFKNNGEMNKKIKLYKCYIQNSEWHISEINKFQSSKYFLEIQSDYIKNNEFYLLADENEIKSFNPKRLIDINSFTNSKPEYRANFKVFIEDSGFSSYQLEYPFSMTTKKGSILSSIHSLLDKNSDSNIIILRNIFHLPIEEKFSAYLINNKTNKVLKKFELITNHTNSISIDPNFITPNTFLVTTEYLCVPIYLSIKDNHISLEHTHPPHVYIHGKRRFERISELKKKMLDIVN